MQVFRQSEVHRVFREFLLAVYLLVNSERGLSGIPRKDLRRPSRGSQQDSLLIEPRHRLDQAPDKR